MVRWAGHTGPVSDLWLHCLVRRTALPRAVVAPARYAGSQITDAGSILHSLVDCRAFAALLNNRLAARLDCPESEAYAFVAEVGAARPSLLVSRYSSPRPRTPPNVGLGPPVRTNGIPCLNRCEQRISGVTRLGAIAFYLGIGRYDITPPAAGTVRIVILPNTLDVPTAARP